jgi:flagellar hook-basal body complex protein FliE
MSKNSRRGFAGGITLAVAIALLTGCSTPAANTPQENEAQVCAATKAYASALTSFKDSLTPTSTVDQVKEAREQVAKAHEDLLKASEAVAKDRVDAVQEAENKFSAAVRAIPDDATLAQVRASLRDEAANVQAALSDLGTAAKC